MAEPPHPLLEGLDPELRLDPAGNGGFLCARLAAPTARRTLCLGRVRGLRRFLACYRDEPFWMKPRVGRALSEVPVDTQFLLLELEGQQHAVIAPLAIAPFKATLQGDGSELYLVLDSGDPELRGSEGPVAYVATGRDPYELCRTGAATVTARLETGRLRRDKPLPALAQYLGWCTWDAFYKDVSLAKVREGLQSFRDGGVEPRLLILDDGWQTVGEAGESAARLQAFAANEKFPGGLAQTMKVAREFGVERVVVWHAVHGYWGGIDPSALPDYGASAVVRNYSAEVLAHQPQANHQHWGASVGRPSREGLAAFYDDYHRYLAEQGISGVKVDNQASIEALCQGQGGRVGFMQATRSALESSVRRHFGGELINCMSCSSEMLYFAQDSTLTRTSTDFWPDIPTSHGQHVYTNAMVGLWFGELVHPDWDMFQSGHVAGPFHAAARAVSGGPIYVSDKPGQQHFGLLKQLSLSDGRTLRAEGVGLPSPDCLFVDPTAETQLLKVWNRNKVGWVLGVFNARHAADGARISGSVGPSDVPEIRADECAVYLRNTGLLKRLKRKQTLELALDSLEAEIVTLMPVDQGVAALGLANKLNGGAAVLQAGWEAGSYVVELADGGDFLAFSERQPRRVEVDGSAASAAWDSGRLSLRVLGSGRHRLRFEFQATLG